MKLLSCVLHERELMGARVRVNDVFLFLEKVESESEGERNLVLNI